MNYLTILFSRLLILFGIILLINSCTKPPVEGCTDPKSLNYNPQATKDDGSCKYPSNPNTSPTCIINNTGQVYFINHSYQDSTLDVYIDTVNIATVAPGDTSKFFTYTAGIPLAFAVKYTKSQTIEQTTQYIYLNQCQAYDIYLY